MRRAGRSTCALAVLAVLLPAACVWPRVTDAAPNPQGTSAKAWLQTSASVLAGLEARHDYVGWRKLASTLFAPDAVIVSSGALRNQTQTLQQYLAAEQQNLASTAGATGTIEHDYVQSVVQLGSQRASAVSELTIHMHEIVNQKASSVDVVTRREYVLRQAGGAWRISRLTITPISVSVDGTFLALTRPPGVHRPTGRR